MNPKAQAWCGELGGIMVLQKLHFEALKKKSGSPNIATMRCHREFA
jgi:hypothetical protein